MNWWVTSYWEQSPVLLVSWVLWVIGSIVLHELAHGWAAIRLGDRTPIELGRMTPNPIVHMGTTSLFVFAFVGIAWGVMPINPSRLRGRHADALVAAAGPAMNLLLATLCIVLGAVWTAAAGGHWFAGFDLTAEPIYGNLRLFFFAGAMLNIVLMLFNLLPIPPLDGGRIVSSFHPGFDRALLTGQGQVVAIGIFLAVFFFGADYLFDYATVAALTAIEWLAGLITNGTA